jgi:translation initiation factor 1 (eIF-1/SUI1)
LHEFVPYRIWQADEAEVGVKNTQPKKHIMIVHRLYTLPAKLRPIIGNEPAVSLTEGQVKERLERYYEQELLRSTKGSVTLDQNIANLLLPADFAHSTVSTKLLLNTCLGLASQSYKIGNDALVRKGSPPKVVTKVKGQGPNGRLVTIVTKLEAYLSKAEIEDIAETLRKRCAGATVVRPGLLPGSIELQIQGAWSKHIQSVLEDHGMAPAWITAERTGK